LVRRGGGRTCAAGTWCSCRSSWGRTRSLAGSWLNKTLRALTDHGTDNSRSFK
jgi:hypothetical protein